MDYARPGQPMKCSRRRSNGGPCANWAMLGQVVCRNHGGASPQAKAAAERRLAHDELEKAVVTYGLPRDVTPEEALLDEVRWTAGHVAWLRERVQATEADALSWGRSSEVAKGSGEFPGTDTTHAAAPPVLLEMYQRERRHLLDVCKVAIQAGIEERRVRLAERYGSQLAAVVQAILDDLRLSAEQWERVPEVVPRMLRAVDDAALPSGRFRTIGGGETA